MTTDAECVNAEREPLRAFPAHEVRIRDAAKAATSALRRRRDDHTHPLTHGRHESRSTGQPDGKKRHRKMEDEQ